MLTLQQQQHYAERGYLVLPDFKPRAELAAVQARALAIVDAFDPGEHVSIFSTRQQASSSDEYFLGSGDQVRCFFEEDAFTPGGSLRQPKALSINKIGHALHDRDPVFERFSHGPTLAELAQDLGLVAPQLWQSMFIFKQPGIGGEVRWHQDATYLRSEPITVTGFWFALEDATLDNGCLWVQPGGHRGPLRERFVRHAPGANRVRLERLDHTPWPTADQAVPLEVAAGSLVVLHGLLPHYSAPNRSAQSRHAYSVHAIDGRSRYCADNWLQRGPQWPVRGFGG